MVEERGKTFLKILMTFLLGYMEHLQIRTNIGTMERCSSICSFHENKYLKEYSFKFKQCCNPFGTHSDSKGRKKSGVRSNLKEVSLEETDILDYCQEEASDISNLSLSLLDCSPLKKVRAERTSLEGKRKIKDASSKIANVISVALGDPSLAPSSNGCKSCEELVCAIGEKMKISDRKTQLQLLTLVPDNEKKSTYFSVPIYMA